MAVKKGGGLHLVSEEINSILGIDVAVLMGANLAPEVANDNFCEATIGRFLIFFIKLCFFF